MARERSFGDCPPTCLITFLYNKNNRVSVWFSITWCSSHGFSTGLCRVFDTYLLLLKQHLNRINDWLSRAEARMNTEEEIGTQYENVKQQLEDHQVITHSGVNSYIKATN